MKTKAALALVATAAACFGGSTLLQLSDWPSFPEVAALLDFADVMLQSVGLAALTLAGVVTLLRIF